jgi:hypothetical protein
MNKEKLVITMVVDDIPSGEIPLSFSVSRTEDVWVSRFKWFKGWKKVTKYPLKITDLKVKKLPPADYE